MGYATLDSGSLQSRKRGRPPTTDKRKSISFSVLGNTSSQNDLVSDELQLGEEDSSSTARKKSARVRKPSRKAIEGDDGEYEDLRNGSADFDSYDELESFHLSKSQNKVQDISLSGIPSRLSPLPDEVDDGDRVSRTISLYADTISSVPHQSGRPVRKCKYYSYICILRDSF